MPQRDHFRSPLDNMRHWEGLHAGWPMMIVASLRRKLPRRYFAEPRVPWKCHHCFKNQVVMGSVHYDAEVRHDGRLHSFTVHDLKIPVCQACGEKVFTEEVDDQIGAALRAHLHLLSPQEIRAGIERLDLTQKEAAERPGIAEATLSRWLTDTQIQSRALDNLLRVFFAFPQVREALAGPHEDRPVLADLT